jgi:polysaccharide deacetylase 2 family uncharacterized protein YibQ
VLGGGPRQRLEVFCFFFSKKKAFLAFLSDECVTSFRPLLIFWLCVLGLLGGGAAVLQVLGPPHATIAAKGVQAPDKPARAVAEEAAHPPPVTRKPAPPQSVGIPDPDPSLQEPTVELPDRMLPRIAPDGRTPAQKYAASFDATDLHPRVALVIDGIGLDRALSEQVLRTLPREIDIAFSIYAVPKAIEALGAEARRQGRECLVSIPMEPAGSPNMEEGERSLTTGAIPEQNRLNLEWSLSSVQGCVGATGASDGMEGERFAESRQALGEVLSALDHRGLLYLDPRPGAPPLEQPSPDHDGIRVVDVVVDKPLSPDEPASADAIDRNLATLERLAAAHGSAIGLAGPPRTVLLERLAVWANGLAARHLALAPLTAIPPPRPATQDAQP